MLSSLGVLLVASGCKVYDPALLDAGPSQDSGPCNPRRPPPRPTTADGPDGPDVVFALKEVVLDQSPDAWRDIGFDLDGLCSVPPNPTVECVPPDPTARPETDGTDGIDNVFGHLLFPLVQVTVPDLEQTAQHSQEIGVGSAILSVHGWNHQDNDPRVDVVVTQSVFGTPGNMDGTAPDVTVDGGAGTLPDGGALPLPMWDGNDFFWVRSDNYFMGDMSRPLVQDNNAYVKDRTLVVTMPDGVSLIFTSMVEGLLVRLTDAHAMGTISADETRLSDVVVGGRWSVLDLLSTAEAVGVCDGTAEFRILSSQLDRIADVRRTPGTGGTGVPCDAISIGVTFQGYSAHVGGIATGRTLPDLCAEGGVPLDGSVSADGGTPPAPMVDGGN